MSSGVGQNMVERGDRPSQDPSLEIVQNNSMSIRDAITDLELALQRMEDYLRGSRLETAQKGGVEGCASGILAQLCQVGADNHDRLMIVGRRMASIANSLGVPQ